MSERAEQREHIVLAAIACLERRGVQGATVREIAREAGVNVAAINYYFGSKSALMEAALTRTLDTGFDLSELDERIAATGDLRGATEAFLLDYLTHAQEYPRVAGAHLHEALSGGELSPELRRRAGALLRGLAERLAPLLGPGREEERVRAVSQLWSAILLPGLFPGFFRGAGLDVADEEERRTYVSALVARFLGGEP